VTVGRLFSRDEIAFGSKVAIIGQTIADKLFNGESLNGETLRIDSVPFTIVGVLEPKGSGGSGKSQDDLVVVPLRAARSRCSVFGCYYTAFTAARCPWKRLGV
jgi:putative ABC transport system permease protein